MLIDPVLMREIDEKMALVESDRSLNLDRIIRKALEQDSLISSGLLEAGSTRREKREKKREFAESTARLSDACRFAVGNYRGQITEDLILGIVSRINSEVTGYRNSTVRVTGPDAVLPPQPEKIKPQIETLLEHTNDVTLHTLERAGLSHLHLVRIHPFTDGNGRTARLLQNLVLKYEEYPPAIIPCEERIVYQHILRSALEGYRDREAHGEFLDAWSKPLQISKAEQAFFNYIGSKVNIALESQITAIDRLPRFTVRLRQDGHATPGYTFTAKKVIANYFRAEGRLGQARVDIHRDPGTIKVIGDISEGVIKSILDHRGYKGKYDIERQK